MRPSDAPVDPHSSLLSLPSYHSSTIVAGNSQIAGELDQINQNAILPSGTSCNRNPTQALTPPAPAIPVRHQSQQASRTPRLSRGPHSHGSGRQSQSTNRSARRQPLRSASRSQPAPIRGPQRFLHGQSASTVQRDGLESYHCQSGVRQPSGSMSNPAGPQPASRRGLESQVQQPTTSSAQRDDNILESNLGLSSGSMANPSSLQLAPLGGLQPPRQQPTSSMVQRDESFEEESNIRQASGSAINSDRPQSAPLTGLEYQRQQLFAIEVDHHSMGPPGIISDRTFESVCPSATAQPERKAVPDNDAVSIVDSLNNLNVACDPAKDPEFCKRLFYDEGEALRRAQLNRILSDKRGFRKPLTDEEVEEEAFEFDNLTHERKHNGNQTLFDKAWNVPQDNQDGGFFLEDGEVFDSDDEDMVAAACSLWFSHGPFGQITKTLPQMADPKVGEHIRNYQPKNPKFMAFLLDAKQHPEDPMSKPLGKKLNYTYLDKNDVIKASFRLMSKADKDRKFRPSLLEPTQHPDYKRLVLKGNAYNPLAKEYYNSMTLEIRLPIAGKGRNYDGARDKHEDRDDVLEQSAPLLNY